MEKCRNRCLDLFAKELTVKDMLRFGFLAAGLLFCFGCGGGEAPSTEAETQQLYDSPDYEEQMMGATSEGGGTSEEGGATDEGSASK